MGMRGDCEPLWWMRCPAGETKGGPHREVGERTWGNELEAGMAGVKHSGSGRGGRAQQDGRRSTGARARCGERLSCKRYPSAVLFLFFQSARLRGWGRISLHHRAPASAATSQSSKVRSLSFAPCIRRALHPLHPWDFIASLGVSLQSWALGLWH